MESNENDPLEVSSSGSSSFTERLINVIASPSEAFEDLRGAPVNHVNWAIPLVMSILAGILFSVVVFSQDNVLAEMRQAQEREFDKQVEAGKMTSAQAEAGRKALETYMTPKIIMGGAVVATIFVTPIIWLLLALFLLLLARFVTGSPLPYSRCYEVVGLTSIISVLAVLVNMLLVVISGNVASTLSLSLIFQEFDPSNRTHAIAAEINPLQWWYLAVVAIAWARLTRSPAMKCATWIFGIWFLFRGARIALFL